MKYFPRSRQYFDFMKIFDEEEKKKKQPEWTCNREVLAPHFKCRGENGWLFKKYSIILGTLDNISSGVMPNHANRFWLALILFPSVVPSLYRFRRIEKSSNRACIRCLCSFSFILSIRLTVCEGMSRGFVSVRMDVCLILMWLFYSVIGQRLK